MYSQAIDRANDLRQHLLAHGVKRVTIELVEGRGGSGWSDNKFVATMGHHIATRRTQGLTPGLYIVKNGRTDLPGPLCNGYGGFDETARIICMSWANHPGYGGPFHAESGTIPLNNGRPYFFGWEFEGGLNVADFTPSYRQFMARCLGGTLDWLNRTTLSHAEHKTWAPTRKVDRLGYSLLQAVSEIRTLDRTDVDIGDQMTPAQEEAVNELVVVRNQLVAQGSNLSALVAALKLIKLMRKIDEIHDAEDF